MKTRCIIAIVLCVGLLMMPVLSAAGSRIDKVKRTGKLTVGAREGSPPFGFYDQKGNWVGWSMDLSSALHKLIEKKLGMDIELVFKPVTAQTRIPLIVNGTLDWVLGSAAITVDREGVIDFSIQNNANWGALLVPKDSPIRKIEDLGGKRIGVTAGSTDERMMTQMGQTGRISPAPRVITFSKHSEGFLALQQGKTDAHFTADIFLEGLRVKAPNPEKFEVRGFPEELGYRVTGLLLPENDSDWRDMVNHALCYFVRSGGYYELYEEWFGPDNPKAGFPRPLRDPIKTVLYWQCWGGTDNWLK